jgi:hypothetical protein
MNRHQLSIAAVEGTFAVCKLGSRAGVQPWMQAGPIFSITRTPDELSVVCRQDAVPEEVEHEAGWRCICVAGVVPFSAVGVLASLTAPLAAERISVFAVSTFNTDYLFVKNQDYDRAVSALRRAGHSIA